MIRSGSVHDPSSRAVRVTVASCLVIVAAAWILPIVHDVFRFYFSSPDPDIAFMMQAVRRLSGMDAMSIAHPAYTYRVLLSWWYQAGHFVGYVPAITLDGIMASADAETALSYLISSGRLLSGVLASLFSVVFYLSLRLVLSSSCLALTLSLIFATGQGLAGQTFFMRTELLACLFGFSAFASLLAANRVSHRLRVTLFCLAGGCVALAMLTKIQIVITLLMLPLILLLCGDRLIISAADDMKRYKWRSGVLGTTVLIGLLLVLGLALCGWIGLLKEVAATWLATSYQLAIAGYVVLTMLLYSKIFEAGRQDLVRCSLALVVGIGLGLSTVYYYYHQVFFSTVANFVTKLPVFALRAQDVIQGEMSIAERLTGTIDVFVGMSGAWVPTLLHLKDPRRMLLWFTLLGAAWLMWRGRSRPAALAGALLLLATGQEFVFYLRYTGSRTTSFITKSGK